MPDRIPRLELSPAEVSLLLKRLQEDDEAMLDFLERQDREKEQAAVEWQ